MAEETPSEAPPNPAILELEASKAEAKGLAQQLQELNQKNYQTEQILKAHPKID